MLGNYVRKIFYNLADLGTAKYKEIPWTLTDDWEEEFPSTIDGLLYPKNRTLCLHEWRVRVFSLSKTTCHVLPWKATEFAVPEVKNSPRSTHGRSVTAACD
jgi:hypothetical protein